MKTKLLTVAMATYEDFDGCWPTIRDLRIHHPRVEILVIDNAPLSCKATKGVTEAAGGKYFHRPDLCGTSKPRDACFTYAETDWVCVVDCHILFMPGAVQWLLEYIERNPLSKNILSGPLLHDDDVTGATHWQPNPTCGLWGEWATDYEKLIGNRQPGFRLFEYFREDPFEIPMQGLGLFAMCRMNWPGFNPLFQGFGGEEGYIHEKVRRNGGKALCCPKLGWYHRFRSIGGFQGVPYPLRDEDHIWNLLVGHRELGIEAEDKIYQHFGKRVADVTWQSLVDASRKAQPFGFWNSLEANYKRHCLWRTPINEHLPMLRWMASKAERVVELGVATASSTTALLSAKPKYMRSYDINPECEKHIPKDIPEGTNFKFVALDSLVARPEECDLLFIDTYHTAAQLQAELDRHGVHCVGRIILHDTEIFGDTGEDGSPGLRHAVRYFLEKNPEWKVMGHFENNSGLTILSRIPSDPSMYPSWLGTKLAPTLKILGIWYTNNAAPQSVMVDSLNSIRIASLSSRHMVMIRTSVWEIIAGNPFPQVCARDRSGTHLGIVKQQLDCVASADPFEWEIICFLEHDVLYPDDYFDRVADAFLGNPSANVVVNLDYEGLNATGWLKVKERHEPLHQMSMRRKKALANFERCIHDYNAQVPDTMLEPDSSSFSIDHQNVLRRDWHRIGFGFGKPAIHINHPRRFTSHGEVVFEADSGGVLVHPYWGKAADHWPGGELEMKRSGPPASNLPPLDLNQLYEHQLRTSTDINEHMPYLKELASTCNHVTELSCWNNGALMALASGRPKKLISVCPNEKPEWQLFHSRRLTMGDRTTFTSMLGHPLAAVIEETDLLFISTVHNGEFLLQELTRYADKVRKFIVIQNTGVYGENGDGGGKGLRHGVADFLERNEHWDVAHDDRKCNGIMTLIRLQYQAE